MKMRFILASLYIPLSISILASPPQTPETGIPSPAAVVAAPLPPPVPPDPLPSPYTLDQLDHLPLEGGLAEVWHNALVNQQQGLLSEQPPTAADGQSSVETDAARLVPLLNATTTVAATNDANIEAEPAVTAIKIGTTNYTIVANIRYDSARTNPRLYVSYNRDWGAFSVPQQLPIPAGWTLAADPYFAENTANFGVGPLRVYLCGILATTTVGGTTAVAVWHSDDGGQTWPGLPTIVIAEPGGDGIVVDKPTIVVSSHTPTWGYVYVAYVIVTPTRTSNSLRVARSTDGGATFPTMAVIAFDDVQGPSLAVNPSTGAVYCTWLNIGVNDIRTATSTDFGVSFGPHEKVWTGGNLLTDISSGGNYIKNYDSGHRIKAWSFPMTRYDNVAARLIVTYHGGTVSTLASNVDVFYTYRPCSSQCNFWGWELPHMVNDVTVGDQFFPAIDFNAAGNVMISFYDRRNDVNNVKYELAAATLSPTGALLGQNLIVPSTSTTARGVAFIGDYRDHWDWPYVGGESVAATRLNFSAVSPYPSDLFLHRLFF